MSERHLSIHLGTVLLNVFVFENNSKTYVNYVLRGLCALGTVMHCSSM